MPKLRNPAARLGASRLVRLSAEEDAVLVEASQSLGITPTALLRLIARQARRLVVRWEREDNHEAS